MTRIAVIGGGKIGGALIGGLIDGGVDPQSIYVVEHSAERTEELREEFGIVDADDLEQAVDGSDVVFMCLKPHVTVPVLDEVADIIDNSEGDSVVVSMAAGITLEALEAVCAVGTAVVRVMPNTPMLVGKGMSAIAPGRFATAAHMDLVAELLEKVGTVERVSESQMAAVTALSGSGPAYFFQFVEAMIDAGVSLGLTREQSQRLATATAAGAAEMMAQDGADPVRLRADVTSPGGTTAAATRVFEEEGLRRAVHRALAACSDKAIELGRKK
ncbi:MULTISPECIES: pyrroline-5-carboxylate reductase [unclassified Corynebacterium]|uniref:pyrroline-5-carboxylate reductase n=1 Tax=unclassified Corynebacterium TaxID=2624378 RepID=UPI00309B46EF